jgi:hypothetical protein
MIRIGGTTRETQAISVNLEHGCIDVSIVVWLRRCRQRLPAGGGGSGKNEQGERAKPVAPTRVAAAAQPRCENTPALLPPVACLPTCLPVRRAEWKRVLPTHALQPPCALSIYLPTYPTYPTLSIRTSASRRPGVPCTVRTNPQVAWDPRLAALPLPLVRKTHV